MASVALRSTLPMAGGTTVKWPHKETGRIALKNSTKLSIGCALLKRCEDCHFERKPERLESRNL